MRIYTFLFSLSILAFGSMGVNSYAESSYLGFSYSSLDWDFDNESLDPDVLSTRIGFQLSETLAIEGRIGTGVNSSQREFLGSELELDDMMGGYLKFNAPSPENIAPYLLVGYTEIDAIESLGVIEVENILRGASLGIGLDVRLDRSLVLNLEYVNYLKDAGVDVSGFSLGLSAIF